MQGSSNTFFLSLPQPTQSTFLALSNIILNHHPSITPEWKYSMPFFYYNGRMLCYLWTNKKTGQPYIGFADGNKMDFPELIQEKRSRMKIFMVDAENDLPVKKITLLLKMAITILEKK
ncbi:MAG TPA: DUF1801 domain-containing protein [Chitinophagales bacterium]|jgi:hypothetical protein|nr:DUF1801 domain-containing protein [Chitinophagales bacterium]HRG85768.1 DUF1801 domain-containing protein [Chitinophagales bacterium]